MNCIPHQELHTEECIKGILPCDPAQPLELQKEDNMPDKKITFEKLTKKEIYGECCEGGIETKHHSLIPVSWLEIFDGWQIVARLCDVCKIEVETYVNNQLKEKLND